MNKLLKINFLFYISFSFSCAIPNSIRKEMYCYSGANTGLENLIKINGLYCKYNKEENINCKQLLFFSYDGTFLDGISNIADSLFLNKFKKNPKKYLSQTGTWGWYRLDKDTIKVQMLNKNGSVVGWYAEEVWYKILDRSSIKEINRFLFDEIGNSRYLAMNDSSGGFKIKGKIDFNRIDSFRFQPLNLLPPTDYLWLKKKKWFWCKK